jgi:hypothetical protein
MKPDAKDNDVVKNISRIARERTGDTPEIRPSLQAGFVDSAVSLTEIVNTPDIRQEYDVRCRRLFAQDVLTVRLTSDLTPLSPIGAEYGSLDKLAAAQLSALHPPVSSEPVREPVSSRKGRQLFDAALQFRKMSVAAKADPLPLIMGGNTMSLVRDMLDRVENAEVRPFPVFPWLNSAREKGDAALNKAIARIISQTLSSEFTLVAADKAKMDSVSVAKAGFFLDRYQHRFRKTFGGEVGKELEKSLVNDLFEHIKMRGVFSGAWGSLKLGPDGKDLFALIVPGQMVERAEAGNYMKIEWQ